MASSPATAAAYHVDIDPDTARDLAQQGAAVLMLGVPPGSYIGVDHQAFAAGPMFKGIKMLPPGPHFFSCRASSTTGEAAPPTGFFMHLAPRQIVVKTWDTATEQLVDMADEDEARRFADGVRRFDFDAYLAPYDLSSYQRWASLSGHIDADLIASLSPVGGNISIMAEAEDPDLLDPKTAAEKELVRQLQEGRVKLAERMQKLQVQSEEAAHPAAAEAMETEAPADAKQHHQQQQQHQAAGTSGRCFYTRLPRLVKQHGLTAAELTAANLDKSAVMLKAVHQRYGGNMERLLGELQFAFAAFVFGQSLDGFAQWKSLLTLMLGCEDAAMHGQQRTFIELLRVVRLQLVATLGPDSSAAGGTARPGEGQEAPFGLPMIEELLPDSFLRRMFGRFFQMLHEHSDEVSVELYREVAAVKQLLRTRLGWEYDVCVIGDVDEEEDEEDMPVIVDTSEPYAM